MKILLIGGSGMLGTDLIRLLGERDHEVIRPSHREMDITNPAAVSAVLQEARPVWTVLSAAFTRVDDCEKERELAFAVNAEGPRNVARACRAVGSRLLYVSTDYVFDGGKEGAYLEGDPVAPLNVYGASKLEGERNVAGECADHVIARTTWLYGLNGRNFVETIIAKSATAPVLKVVNDQRGAPTYTRDLAEGLLWLMEADARGIVNVTNSGICTWFDFARSILRESGIQTPVEPVSSAAFNAPARRPANSVLSQERFVKLTGRKLRDWETALKDYLRLRGNR